MQTLSRTLYNVYDTICGVFYYATRSRFFSIKASLEKNEISLNNNKLHIKYHSIHSIVSSIKTYDMMMAQ